MLSRITAVQECDATKADSSNAVGKHKKDPTEVRSVIF